MHADVVVVGAGVIGCSIALELSRAGHAVVVLDKLGSPGHGSTSASSAVVRFNFSTWDGVAAAWESRHAWEDWAAHLGASTAQAHARYVRCGLAMLDVEVAPRQLYLPSFDRAGIDYEEWDDRELARRVPHIDVGRYWPPARLADERFWHDAPASLGAVYTADAGYVSDPQRATQDLADAAARHGTRFVMRSRVVEVCTAGRAVTGVRLADGQDVQAPVVVNAAGPWSSALNALAGVGGDFTVGVRPMRQEVHRVPVPAQVADAAAGWPSIADMDLGIYLRGDSGQGLLVGGTEPECDPLQWLDDPDDAAPSVTADAYAAQVTRAARRLPVLGVPDKPRGVVGVYDVSDDWTPIYDRTELDGWFVAMGTSGNQFKNAPVVGQFLRALIEAVSDGADHDRQPVRVKTARTGNEINLGAFSRRRDKAATSGTVMG